MLTTLALVCECVGAAALASVLVWLVAVSLTKLRPSRLLDRLSSRAVLITGCDSGFGHELTRRLDSLGVPVLAGCLFPDGAGARSLKQDCSPRLRVLPLDVTSDQKVADAVASVQAALKDNPGTELWAVLNNAGIADCGEVELAPLEKYQKVLDVNTVGAIRVSKAFLPLLKKSKGRLINVCSPAGRIPVPMLSAYCVSKCALIMFTDILRLEMKKWSVTVSSIEPSLYGTRIADIESIKSMFFENTEKTLSDDRDQQESRKEFEVILRALKWCTKSNISEVIDEMVIACVGRNAQRRHIPGFAETISYTTVAMLPDWLKDFLVQSFLRTIKIIWG